MEHMSMIREEAILRNRSIPGRRPGKEPMISKESWDEDMVRENVIIRDDYSDQPVVINVKLSVGCKRGCRSSSKECRRVCLEAGGRRKRCLNPGWVTNAIPIKQKDGTWQVQTDFTSLNKVCPKDMYPFPEVEEKFRSLIGHRYKYFLRSLKEGS
nr:hypothetical protein [Tanacetum cinerariifolium]